MKLAIYTVEVRCPDDWDDSNWSDQQQDKLDQVMLDKLWELAEQLAAKVDSALTVTVHD